jgi:hypothetical protein
VTQRRARWNFDDIVVLRLSLTWYPLGYLNPKWVFNRILIVSNRVPI